MKINRTCVGLSKFSNQFKCGVNKPDIIILPTGLVTPGSTWSGDWPRETNYEFMANWKERKCLFAPECFCSYHKRTVHPAVKQNCREISMKALWPFTWLTVDLMNKVWLMMCSESGILGFSSFVFWIIFLVSLFIHDSLMFPHLASSSSLYLWFVTCVNLVLHPFQLWLSSCFILVTVLLCILCLG